MNSTKFRKELIKIMPGYKWTVHRTLSPEYCIHATGIMSAGFNRMSTLQITKRKRNDTVEYEAKSAGFGLNAPWLSKYIDQTLARALRGLQDHYDNMTANYSRHAGDLRTGRKPPK